MKLFNLLRSSRRHRHTVPTATAEVDTLEPRVMLTSYLPPSGNTEAFLQDGDLIINNAQGTEILREDGRLLVQPQSGSSNVSVNNGLNFSIDHDDFTGDVIVNGYFFSAADVSLPGNLDLTETRGVVRVQRTTIGGNFVDSSVFHELHFNSSRVHGSMNLKSPWAFSTMANSTIGGDFLVTGNSASNWVNIANSTVHGRTEIKTGGGSDHIRLQNMQMEGSVFINTGSGSDRVEISDSEMAKRTTVITSRGTDTIMSTNDSFVGKAFLHGGGGRDTFKITAPTFWGTETSELFQRLRIHGDGGTDSYELTDPRVTSDRFTASNRRTPEVAETESEQRVMELANSVFPTSGGMPVRVELDPTDASDAIYIVTYPVRSAEFFESGRPQVRVDLLNKTAEVVASTGGRARDVEYFNVELDDDWWDSLPD